MSRTVGLVFPKQEEPDKPKLLCPVCGKGYASEKTLAAHIEKEHPDYKTE